MELDVWLYGDLARFAGGTSGGGYANLTVTLPAGSTLEGLLDSLGMATGERGFTFINGNLSAMPGIQADLDRELKHKDRVAFFHLKSMWPAQYRQGASLTEEIDEALHKDPEQGLRHSWTAKSHVNREQISRDEQLRYRRTLMLPEIGESGQEALKAASVLIIGAGGLGSVSSLYLAAAGVGRIGIVDPDSVELSNLQRQIAHSTEAIGTLKVHSARERIAGLNPHVLVDTFNMSFNPDNSYDISSDYDILADGTDNLKTRYLINDICVRAGKPYVYGAVYRFEGQVGVFDALKGPCYRCLFPKPPQEDDHISDMAEEEGMFSVVPGIIGTIQASEVIKLILGIGNSLSGRMLLCDVLGMTFQEVLLSKNPDCLSCKAGQ
ncbi:MAG: molybdopterin-synthase adenylyltransferase MoeB [Syntrophales bacterium]|nr:molybdopterin-synthase adenylyltransferase MoeB [Syntrophales bacterium]